MNDNNKNNARLVIDPVGKTLINLTLPMIFGMLGIVVFNLVDTYFVGRLGTIPLAALSFTLPVVLVIGSIALGLGIGASAVISRAIGEGNHHKVERITTDSLFLALISVGIFVVIGFFTIDPLFRALGAGPDVLPLVKIYMKIWYAGVLFLVFPMVGNNAIRAAGDTFTPSIIMMIGFVTNIILDPILIFGIGPFPRMEIAGAAVATVIARSVTLVFSLYVLIYREKMITFDILPFKSVVESWKSILYIGLPTAVTRVAVPIAVAVVLRIIAFHGVEAVAAFGVGSRIEFFALVVVVALSNVIVPFVGQNWGAGELNRVKEGISYGNRFAMAWGFFTFVALAVFARPIASLFNGDPLVFDAIVLYLRIVPIGYGLFGVGLISASALNALHKPLHAAVLTIIEMFVLYVPLALLGSYFFGLIGIFSSFALTFCVAGVLAYFLVKATLLSLA